MSTDARQENHILVAPVSPITISYGQHLKCDPTGDSISGTRHARIMPSTRPRPDDISEFREGLRQRVLRRLADCLSQPELIRYQPVRSRLVSVICWSLRAERHRRWRRLTPALSMRRRKPCFRSRKTPSNTWKAAAFISTTSARRQRTLWRVSARPRTQLCGLREPGRAADPSVRGGQPDQPGQLGTRETSQDDKSDRSRRFPPAVPTIHSSSATRSIAAPLSGRTWHG